MAYSEKVLDHYENPRNVGTFAKEVKRVGTGMVGAPACGDVMKLQIKVDENGIIEDAKFKTYGCGWQSLRRRLSRSGSRGSLLMKHRYLKTLKLLRNLHYHQSKFIVRFLQKMQSKQQ